MRLEDETSDFLFLQLFFSLHIHNWKQIIFILFPCEKLTFKYKHEKSSKYRTRMKKKKKKC